MKELAVKILKEAGCLDAVFNDDRCYLHKLDEKLTFLRYIVLKLYTIYGRIDFDGRKI